MAGAFSPSHDGCVNISVGIAPNWCGFHTSTEMALVLFHEVSSHTELENRATNPKYNLLKSPNWSHSNRSPTRRHAQQAST